MNRVVLFIVSAALAVALIAVVMLRRGPAPPEGTTRPAPSAAATPAPAPPPLHATVPPAAPRAARPRAATPAENSAVPAPAAEAAPETGRLQIDSDVPGAQVFIDRQFVGVTPVTVGDVKPGPHQLNASADGFDGVAKSIDVAPGSGDLLIQFREVRLNARADVIHKHRVGSCRGRLVATARELRYETTDKDDGFAVPLAGVETFEVDYLQKNLKLKLRQGKSYNFADPEGNADRLFVFHRDVERARERLRKGDRPAAD